MSKNARYLRGLLRKASAPLCCLDCNVVLRRTKRGGILKYKVAMYMKKVLIFISVAALVLGSTACNLPKEQTPDSDNLAELEKGVLKTTAFEKEVDYLRQKGLELPDLPPDSWKVKRHRISD